MCSFIQEVTPRAPTILITRGSRLGSLYYENITTLAMLPRRIRHDQPNESRQRPCGQEARWRPPAARRARPLLPREGREHGVARWWGRHAAPQLEHMPSQWCTGYKACVLIIAGPSTKLFAWGGGGDMGGHVLRETRRAEACVD
jgi:hypothetical protein